MSEVRPRIHGRLRLLKGVAMNDLHLVLPMDPIPRPAKWIPEPEEEIEVRNYEASEWVRRHFLRMAGGMFECRLLLDNASSIVWRFARPTKRAASVVGVKGDDAVTFERFINGANQRGIVSEVINNTRTHAEMELVVEREVAPPLKWCNNCMTATHNDRECWSTRTCTCNQYPHTLVCGVSYQWAKKVGVQACRPEDRTMLGTKAGAELLRKAAEALQKDQRGDAEECLDLKGAAKAEVTAVAPLFMRSCCNAVPAAKRAHALAPRYKISP